MITYYIYAFKRPHPKNATAGTENTTNSTVDSSTVAGNGTVDNGICGDGDEGNLRSFTFIIFGQGSQ